MKRRLVLGICALAVLGLAIGGCTWFGTQSLGPQSISQGEDYILTFNRLPGDVEGEVEAAGGIVNRVLEELDAVLVTATSPDFLAQIAGVRGLSATIVDASVDWLPDEEMIELAPEHIGSDETYFDLFQWSMLAIDAPGAWDAGYTGDGVRVVVMDTGLDAFHPDLAPNINVALSADYTGEPVPPGYPDWQDLHSHGSNVGGIIGAADNGLGVIGVAPNAELIAYKVLASTGSGSFGWMIAALYDAVEIDADIVNMSLGAYMDKGGFFDDDGVWVPANEVAAFLNLLKAAINYADRNGVTVITSAGNDALDGQGDSGLLHVPSDLGASICVSATGPFGWWLDPTTNLDEFAIYSNYGPQIDFAAPGGNFDATLPFPFPAAYDFVFGCFVGGYGWMAGTSQATPHVAGVAALIIEANGGDMRPQHVLRDLRQSADDLGKPGQDVYYGHGRVNAARAVGQ